TAERYAPISLLPVFFTCPRLAARLLLPTVEVTRCCITHGSFSYWQSLPPSSDSAELPSRPRELPRSCSLSSSRCSLSACSPAGAPYSGTDLEGSAWPAPVLLAAMRTEGRSPALPPFPRVP